MCDLNPRGTYKDLIKANDAKAPAARVVTVCATGYYNHRDDFEIPAGDLLRDQFKAEGYRLQRNAQAALVIQQANNLAMAARINRAKRKRLMLADSIDVCCWVTASEYQERSLKRSPH
jgi:hypothetical protein